MARLVQITHDPATGHLGLRRLLRRKAEPLCTAERRRRSPDKPRLLIGTAAAYAHRVFRTMFFRRS